MTRTADAVVIGTGIIGAAIAYELALTGLRVISVDRLGDVGSGSTSSSSSIIRFHYSTFEGVAASWDAKFAWETWRDYLGAPADETLARYLTVGCLILDGSTDRERVLSHFEQIGIPYHCWDGETIRQQVPGLDPGPVLGCRDHPAGSARLGPRTVRSSQAGHRRRILGRC